MANQYAYSGPCLARSSPEMGIDGIITQLYANRLVLLYLTMGWEKGRILGEPSSSTVLSDHGNETSQPWSRHEILDSEQASFIQRGNAVAAPSEVGDGSIWVFGAFDPGPVPFWGIICELRKAGICSQSTDDGRSLD